MKDRLRLFLRKRWRQYKEDRLCYEYLKDKQRILEVGAGTGRFMEWFKPDQIIGIDANENSVEICRNKGLNVKLMNALEMEFDEPFDAIHCSHIVEHFYPHELYKFLQLVDRHLKPGGLLIIRTPLLWDGFYNDLSHIRPYNPHVFIRYLCYGDTQQKTRRTVSSNYEVIKLEYRYLPLIFLSSTKNKWETLIKGLSDFLAYSGIHSWKKDAYTLILRKGKKG